MGDGSVGTRGARARAVPGQVGRSRQHVRRVDARVGGARRDAGRDGRGWRRRRRDAAAVGAPAVARGRRGCADVGGTGATDGTARVQTRERRDDATASTAILFAVLRALDALPPRARPYARSCVCRFGDPAGHSGRRVAALTRTRPRVVETRGGGQRRLHLAGHSWRRLDAELARYDAWWRSLPLFRTRVLSAKKRRERNGGRRLGRGLVLLERRRRERAAGVARLLAVNARRALRLVQR